MRIAYLLNWDTHWGRGILNKVSSQALAWRELGHQVSVFMLARFDDRIDLSSRLDPGITLDVQSCRSVPDRFVQYGPLTQRVLHWKPDVVYLRYEGCYPALVRLARQIPVVCEINTDDLGEYALGPRYRDWYNRLTRGLLIKHIAGMVFVTEELARKPHFSSFRKPGVIIGNGIRLDAYPVLPAPHNLNPRLAFVGSAGQAWHGTDKILLLAEGCPDWRFDVVGMSPGDLGAHLPSNLVAHGALNRAQYEPILACADVAIGTLALHHKRMEEASPLKVREYLAYGLPTITAYLDTDFPTCVPFILRLPNTPDNVVSCRDAIKGFVTRVKGARVPRDPIAHLDVRLKERKRLEFLDRVTQGGRG